jgi:leucine-rich repeat protein SHOC2
MTPAELEKIILVEQGKRLLNYQLFDPNSLGRFSDVIHLYWLCLKNREIVNIPENIGNFSYFIEIDLSHNKLKNLPGNFQDLNNLTKLNLSDNQLATIPDSLSFLTKLTKLNLNSNQLANVSDNIGNLTELIDLNLSGNEIEFFPDSLGQLTQLVYLDLSNNQIEYLPASLRNLVNLKTLFLGNNHITTLSRQLDLENAQLDPFPKQLDLGLDLLIDISSSMLNLTQLKLLDLTDNPLTDLSILQKLPARRDVYFYNISLPRRYWTKLSEWKSEWLLDENNVEIRQVLIDRIGYDRICTELNAVTIDTWREYTLLKIDDVEKIYDDGDEPIDTEPMVLLKMTCPSTEHIHILRVPPAMVSAEAAITWVNHGIHPDEFIVQT